MAASAWLNLLGDRLWSVPMLIVYLTDRCNSRCVSCDYWRVGEASLSREHEDRLVDEVGALGVKGVLLSGGEAMQHPRWVAFSERLVAEGLTVWLLTNGLLLDKQHDDVVRLCGEVIVSMDGADAETYAAIRGVDAFGLVCRGVRRVVEAGVPVTLRCTVQAGNYDQLDRVAALGAELGAQVSFLAADTDNTEAFARVEAPSGVALDLPQVRDFGRCVDRWRREGALSPELQRSVSRLQRFYAARLGLDSWPPVRCNTPRFSAVVEPDGRVRPCFFLPATGHLDEGLAATLHTPEARAMRRAQQSGQRPECERCVCWLHQGPRAMLRGDWPA